MEDEYTEEYIGNLVVKFEKEYPKKNALWKGKYTFAFNHWISKNKYLPLERDEFANKKIEKKDKSNYVNTEV